MFKKLLLKIDIAIVYYLIIINNPNKTNYNIKKNN